MFEGIDSEIKTPELNTETKVETEAEIEEKLIAPYLEYARSKLLDPQFTIDLKDCKDKIKEEFKKNQALQESFKHLSQKNNFHSPNTKFKTISQEEAFYGCGIVKANEGKQLEEHKKPFKDHYILTNDGFFFQKSTESQPTQLELQVGKLNALKDYFKESKAFTEATKEDLEFIKSCLNDPSQGSSANRTAISPGMLVSSNADFESIVYIDPPANTIRFQDVLNEILSDKHILKIRISVHYVTINNKKQPVIEYHANSGNDKEAVRIVERGVLDALVDRLLQHHETVQVNALLHEPAFEENAEKTALEVENGRLVWSKKLSTLLNEFKHKITQLAAPKRVIYKPRGRFNLQDDYQEEDPFALPQIEKGGLRVWDAHMFSWTAARHDSRDLENTDLNNKDRQNADVLKSTPPPSADCIIDIRKLGSHCPPHDNVTNDTEAGSFLAFGDLARDGKKAFKDLRERYEDQALIKHEESDGTLTYELEPWVKTLQNQAARALYIEAANAFLDIPTQTSLIQRNLNLKAKNVLTYDEIKALDNLKKVVNKYQNNGENGQPKKLTPDSYAEIFKAQDKESKGINAEAVIEFTTALNNVIKTQVSVKDTTTNRVAKAWQESLRVWDKDCEQFNRLKTLIKPTPPPKEGEEPKSYYSGMTPENLRKLSAIKTSGGGCNPLQSFFAAFGLETTGGWDLFYGFPTLSNESLGESLLYEKTEAIAKAVLSSQTNTVFFSGFDSADNKRSLQEIKNENIKAPSVGLNQMIGNWFSLMGICKSVCSDLGIELTQPKPTLAIKAVAHEIYTPYIKPTLFFNLRKAYEKTLEGRSSEKCTLIRLADSEDINGLEKSSTHQYILHKNKLWYRAPGVENQAEELHFKKDAKLSGLKTGRYSIEELPKGEDITKWQPQGQSRRYIKHNGNIYYWDASLGQKRQIEKENLAHFEFQQFIQSVEKSQEANELTKGRQASQNPVKTLCSITEKEFKLIEWCTNHEITNPYENEAKAQDSLFDALLKGLLDLHYPSSQNPQPGDMQDEPRKNQITRLGDAILQFHQAYTVISAQKKTKSDDLAPELEWDKYQAQMEEAKEIIKECCGGLRKFDTKSLLRAAVITFLSLILFAGALALLFLNNGTLLDFTTAISAEAIKSIVGVIGLFSLGAIGLGFYYNRPETYDFGRKIEKNFSNYQIVTSSIVKREQVEVEPACGPDASSASM